MWGSEEMLSDSMEISSEYPEVHYKQQCNQYIHLCKAPMYASDNLDGSVL